MSKTPRPFGCWPSPISARSVAGKALRFGDLQAQGNCLYWSESRPEEKGRSALMRLADGGEPEELLPVEFSVRTRVHEYGGGAFTVSTDTVFFINDKDQDIWRLTPGHPPERLTNEPRLRFADMAHDIERNRLIAVAERHIEGRHHPDNLLLAISLETGDSGSIATLVSGADFYAAPTLSPDGAQIAFISWNLPGMPWEGARLQIGRFNPEGALSDLHSPRQLQDGASFQPLWHPDGALYTINDKSGYGQLYRIDGELVQPVTCELPEAEFGLPLWVFGMQTYAFRDTDTIACCVLQQGRFSLCRIDRRNGKLLSRDETLCGLDKPVAMGGNLAGFSASAAEPPSLSLIDTQTGARRTLRQAGDSDLAAGDLSTPRNLKFANELGQPVWAHYYPPQNAAYSGPEGALPPVILTAHGGPTGFADCGLKLKTQFWTSRGFGFCDVNYSGSWGFGRAYRQRLDGKWGVRDVADMLAAARHLVEQDLADPRQLLISGSSAGGYTVLMALATSDLFAAGASYYGISDMARLRDSTHKFEAGYLDRLFGLDGDTDRQILDERSPLKLAGDIGSPVIFFQGLKDKVVPPDQAEMMVEALRQRDVPVDYQTFEEEGHGFRQSSTIETALEMEYAFYARHLGLKPAA